MNNFCKLYNKNNNYNLFIIHLNIKDSKFVKYIYRLDEFHEANKSIDKIIYLFIIHIDKNYFYKMQNDDNNNNLVDKKLEIYDSYLFSFLSEYQQITMDNLLEKRDISVLELVNKTNEELIISEKLFDINFIIKKEFSRIIITLIKDGISLIKKLDNLIENGILNYVIQKIKTSVKQSNCNILKNILIKFSEKSHIYYDFISFFIEEIEKIVSDYLKKLIQELIKSGYFVSYLFEKEIPPKIKKLIFSFINSINISKSVSLSNYDEYIQILKIPGSQILFENIIDLVKLCKTDYLSIENECRKIKSIFENDEIIKKLENIHYEKKQFIKNRLLNDKLLIEDIFNQYFHEIFNDFFIYRFYRRNTTTSLTTKQVDFLSFLFSKKNYDEDENLDRFLYFCLWFEAYCEDIIYKILEIFNKMDEYFKPNKNISTYNCSNFNNDKKTLLDLLKKNYDLFYPLIDIDKDIKFKKVNCIFYSILESLIHIMTNINNLDIDSIDLKSFCIDMNYIAQTLSKISATLNLKLKGHYSFINFSEFIIISQRNNYEEKKIKILLSNFIKYNFAEKCFLLQNDNYQAKGALIEQIKITNNLSGELSSYILSNKLLQYYKNKNYKLELVKLLFEFPHLVKISTLFFNYILFIQPIEPKRQNKRMLNEQERKSFLESFGNFKNSDENFILSELDIYAEKNEYFKEILLYIFELRIISYFEDCKKSKIMKNEEYLILTGLNFDYFIKACDEINMNNFGKLKNLSLLFYIAFIRCYLFYFVEIQLNYPFFREIENIHHHIFNISNSIFGKLIILYIAKIFIIKNKKNYFFQLYLREENNYYWIKAILFDNPEEEFFPIEKFENAKNFLFYMRSNINNNNFKNCVNHLDILDIFYMIDFSYNEMSINIKSNNLLKSQILEELNKNKEEFIFDKSIKSKINKLFEKISGFNFLNNELIKSNIKLIFFMIKLYILGFAGYENNLLFPKMFSDNIIYLIKIFYNIIIENDMIYIQSYYEMKNYLEKEFLIKENNELIYVCSCGRWYIIKDNYEVENTICKCGLKLDGDKGKIVFVIYYDEKHKKNVENRKIKLNKGAIILKGIEEFKNEFIIKKIINKCKRLDKLILFDEEIINDKIFPQIFVKFIFLSQIFIEFEIGVIEFNEIIELNPDTLLNKLICLNKKIEQFIKTKNINYNHFINYLCEKLFNLIKNNDLIKEKNKIFNILSEALKQLEEQYKNSPDEQQFNNLEINVLTSLVCDKEFKNENYKYFLTVAKYPNLYLLYQSIDLQTEKSFQILKSFISLYYEKYINMEHLSHIEIINDFINSFSKKTKNLITRKSAYNETIEYYLNEIRKSSIPDENNIYLIDKQFEEFCRSFEEILNLFVSKESFVINILNNDEIKGGMHSINNLYSHLINLQNSYLNKIIEGYNNSKTMDKEDIIIKNAIEQIKKEKCIQLCTKNDIFSFKVSNNIFLSFEELISFNSLKNIFNENDNKIDYSKYSEIKFNLNMIEKELINTILIGKKLFSEKQITYKFYSAPHETDEISKKFEIFTLRYEKKNLLEEEKACLMNISKLPSNLKSIILPNLKILIFDIIQENKYKGTDKIGQIKLEQNLYIDNNFFQILNYIKNFTINKLISLYEYLEEFLFEFISDRYIVPEFKKKIGYQYKKELDKYYKEESKRELKNAFLTSLLIKFTCRFLPYISKELKSRSLFKMIIEKNITLPKNIKENLQSLVYSSLDTSLSYTIDITKYFKLKHIGKDTTENNEKIYERDNEEDE